jgi:hypothetical protein
MLRRHVRPAAPGRHAAAVAGLTQRRCPPSERIRVERFGSIESTGVTMPSTQVRATQ